LSDEDFLVFDEKEREGNREMTAGLVVSGVEELLGANTRRNSIRATK